MIGASRVEPTRYESESGDNQIANANLEQPRPRGPCLSSKADLFKNDILVQVDAVKSKRRPESMRCYNMDM